jgi:hypothetical protein
VVGDELAVLLGQSDICSNGAMRISVGSTAAQ